MVKIIKWLYLRKNKRVELLGIAVEYLTRKYNTDAVAMISALTDYIDYATSTIKVLRVD